MTRIQSNAASAGLIAALRSLPEGTDQERFVATWKTLCQAADADEFAVVLDFAIDHSLIDSQFAPLLRGDAVVQAPPHYWTNPIDGSEMVWIPPGEFYVGDDGRRATSDGFFLARHPITNRQFEWFLEESGYGPAATHPGNDRFFGRGQEAALQQHPVTWVSFYDALAYCDWALLTLPTEWLWEKAARGTDGREYPWGDAAPQADQWNKTDLGRARVQSDATCAIGRFPDVRSPFGCEDMIGNVSEWCLLESEPGPPEKAAQFVPTPERGAAVNHQAAVRGSAYMRRKASLMNSSHRRKLSAYRRNAWVGFRPAFYPPRHRV